MILQITADCAINANNVMTMHLNKLSGDKVVTAITVRGRAEPVVANGDWLKVWKTALRRGCVWTDGKIYELRS